MQRESGKKSSPEPQGEKVLKSYLSLNVPQATEDEKDNLWEIPPGIHAGTLWASLQDVCSRESPLTRESG